MRAPAKGQGNKIDPAKTDTTAALPDAVLQRILLAIPEAARAPCSLVCQRWLRAVGKLQRILHLLLLPNGTSVKFSAETKNLQSVVELLALVKVNEREQQQEWERSTSRDMKWGRNVWLEDTLGSKLNTDSLLKAILSAKSSGTLQILLHDGISRSHVDKVHFCFLTILNFCNESWTLCNCR
jgi:hypothetical protein